MAWQSWGVGKLLERVEHLVVEDGEVEHHYEANWMRGLHLVFFCSVLTDSILYKVWNMVRCFLRGPFEFKRRNHICLEIILAKAKSLLISLCHFDLFKNFGSFFGGPVQFWGRIVRRVLNVLIGVH